MRFPPFKGLLAFDAVVRLGGISKAADELSLSCVCSCPANTARARRPGPGLRRSQGHDGRGASPGLSACARGLGPGREVCALAARGSREGLTVGSHGGGGSRSGRCPPASGTIVGQRFSRRKDEDMRSLFSALLVFLLGACASVPPDEQTSRDRIEAATRAWQSAYDSRDPAIIVGLYDARAVLWGTTARTIAASRAEIREYFKDAASRPNARVVIGEQHIRVYGETAFNSGYYTFTDVREGQVVPRPARFTLVFHRKAGEWLIVAHHSSVTP